MLWVESLTNPFLRYIDIPKVVDLVKRKMDRRVCWHGCVCVCVCVCGCVCREKAEMILA